MQLLQNILLIFSCLFLIALAIRTGTRLKVIGMPAMFAMILFFMVWVVGNLIETNASDFRWMLWGRNIQQIGVFFAPLCTLYFSIEYTANTKLRVLAYIISIVQLISVFLIFTDQYYHIMRVSVELQTNAVFGHALVVHSTAIGSVLVAFNFCIPLIGLAILVLFTKTVSDKLRRPLWLIIISIFLTFVLAVIQSTFLSSEGINIPIPVLNLPCVVLMTYAVLSRGFIGITPTAFNKVFEVIDQGIIVIDETGRVIEYNKRASELINDIANDDCLKIGSEIAEIMPEISTNTAKKLFSVDDLPTELANSQRNKHISLTFHALEKSGKKFFGHVLVLTDITLLKVRAEIDFLTGVYNRDGLTNVFLGMQKRYENYPCVCAMIIDLDNFKNINDTYGHFGGDIILRDLVRAAQTLLSGEYALGRLGGDEFVLLLPGELDAAVELAEKLRKYVSERSIEYLKHKIYYTISVGVTCSDIKDISLSDFLHKADLALYKAKNQGKNMINISRSTS